MAITRITIDSIINGQGATFYRSGSGQFKKSTGIDPDLSPLPASATARRQGGIITPSQYAKFSGSALSGAPMWLLTAPKTPTGGTFSGENRAYVYASDGEVLTYTSVFGDEQVACSPASGAGNGAEYYNNYFYFATPTNISRFGPLNGTPALEDSFWSGSATFLNKTALVNTTYPVTGGVTYPNHSMHAHSDNKLYFGDFDSTSATANTRGKGLIHYIKTKYGTMNAVTNEGTADDGSSYNALDLQAGFMPTDIESYGTDLVISAIQNADGQTLKQGNSALFFWDTISESFYRKVNIGDPIIGSLLNVNGNLLVFSGNGNNGYSVGMYDGGYGVTHLEFFEEGSAPLPGAVDYYGSRVSWGVRDGIMARGYKNPRLPGNALHHIIKSSSSSETSTVTCAKYLQQASGIVPRMIVGWKNGSNYGIDNFSSSATLTSDFESEIYNINRPFFIRNIKICLNQAVAAGMGLTPKIIVDDDTTTFTLSTINTTNYPNGEMNIEYKDVELAGNSTGAVGGLHNFYLKLVYSGTVAVSVLLPIFIEIEEIED